MKSLATSFIVIAFAFGAFVSPVTVSAQTPIPPQPTSVSTATPQGQTQINASSSEVTLKDVLTVILSLFALFLSLFTAYRTFLARFKGKVWFSNRIVLAHIDSVPSLGLACFFENSGARPGILEDLRAKIELKDSATVSYFYPMLMRTDYSIFRAYSESDWYPFSMVSLPPNFRAEKYLLLKPQNDKFVASKGEMIVTLELRWHGNGKWDIIEPLRKFSLPEQLALMWNDAKTPAYQIISDEVMSQRRQS